MFVYDFSNKIIEALFPTNRANEVAVFEDRFVRYNMAVLFAGLFTTKCAEILLCNTILQDV